MKNPLLRRRARSGRRRLTDHPRGASDRAPRGQADGGAALLELALVLPFLAVVVFGTVDIGRGLALRNRLTNMAREGAFYAQFHPTDVAGCAPTSITGIAKSEDPGLPNAAVTVSNAATGTVVSTNCGGFAASGTRIAVRVTQPMTIYTPLIGAIVGNTVTVGSTTEVVVQG